MRSRLGDHGDSRDREERTEGGRTLSTRRLFRTEIHREQRQTPVHDKPAWCNISEAVGRATRGMDRETLRFTSAVCNRVALVKRSASRSMCRPQAGDPPPDKHSVLGESLCEISSVGSVSSTGFTHPGHCAHDNSRWWHTIIPACNPRPTRTSSTRGRAYTSTSRQLPSGTTRCLTSGSVAARG